MIVKLGTINIADWAQDKSNTWYRSAGDMQDAIYIFKIVDNGINYKEYVPCFFGKLEFLNEQYKTWYGKQRFKTLQDAKSNVDYFLSRIEKIKAFY